MNTKRRFFNQPPPALPVKKVTEAVEANVKPTEPVQPEAVSSLPPTPSVPTPRANDGPKPAGYRIPWILSTLLTDAKNPEIFQTLQDGWNRAREQGNEFYAAIFEGGLAANRVPPDVSDAVRCFHHAFDLSGGKADGFLHGMVWNLFSTSGGDEAVSELLERVRSELRQNTAPGKPLGEALEKTAEALKRVPGFNERLEQIQRETTDRQRRSDFRVFRESRWPKDRSMLLFPKTTSPPGYDYWVGVQGFGTVINPMVDFFDGFFRLGGAIGDLRNIVLSSARKIDPRWFAAFRELFLNRMPDEKFRLFTTMEVVRNFGSVLDELENAGLIETPLLADRSETELAGGGTVLLRPGSTILKTLSDRTLQFVDDSGPGAGQFERTDILAEATVLVLSLDGLSSVHYAKENRPGLAVFDRPGNEGLQSVLREFLAPESAAAFASSALVVDVDRLRFLDAVKAFDDPRGDCWTDLYGLDAARSGESENDEPFFFDQSEQKRYDRERSEIIESFRFYQKRRQGLYFAE